VPDNSEKSEPGVSTRRLEIPTADVIRILALVTAAFLVVRLVWVAHPVLFVFFLGVLFALPISSAADRLEKRGVRRWLSVSLIVVVFCGLLVGGGVIMAPILRTQSVELKEQLPEAMDKIDAWLGVHANGLAALLMNPAEATDSIRAAAPKTANPAEADTTQAVAGTDTDTTKAATSTASSTVAVSMPRRNVVVRGSALRREITYRFTSAQHSFLGVLRSTFAIGAGFLLVLFVAAYIGTDPNLYHGLMLELVPAEKRPHAALTLMRIGATLRQWLTMQLIAMIVIGAITTIFLFAMHVKAALPLGILAGLLKFIPIVGSFFAAIPAVAMAFIDSPHKALVILVGYVVIQFAENHLLIPLLMKAGIDIPPALTLGMQAVMSVLFGFLGLLLAVPFLAALLTIFRTINAEEMRAVAREASTAAPPDNP
jgi:predicted PurR-regulated permease PerM